MVSDMDNLHSVAMKLLAGPQLLTALLLALVEAKADLVLEDRDKIIQDEATLALGGHIHLTPQEESANKIFLTTKRAEIDAGFQNPDKFNPAFHFFHRKPRIEASPLFKTIRTMPKGAALHIHDTAAIGGDYLVKNLTYRNDLYMCSKETSIRLKFALSAPSDANCTWQSVKDARAAFGDDEEFDRKLSKFFTLERENPEEVYTDVNIVWEYFMEIFDSVEPMITYAPVWEDYAYELLKQYYEDGVIYVEIRSTLPEIYDLKGTSYNESDVVRAYKRASDKFKADYPGTYGLKVIYAPLKLVDLDGARKYVEILKNLKEEFGDFIAGFDLVGQEDIMVPLKDYLPALAEVPSDVNVFYHSGETNWYGLSDTNMIDAILLGAKRIGHGYALLKHPLIADLAKSRPVAIEINPLSNQILRLVDDVRNHPGALMIANNFTVVISSDDPGLWGALPLSHDFYTATLAMTNRDSGLEFFKQLSFNSLQYSSLDQIEKRSAIETFEKQWSAFISNMTVDYQEDASYKRDIKELTFEEDLNEISNSKSGSLRIDSTKFLISTMSAIIILCSFL